MDIFCDKEKPIHLEISKPNLMYNAKPCSIIYGTNLMKIGGITQTISYDN